MRVGGLIFGADWKGEEPYAPAAKEAALNRIAALPPEALGKAIKNWLDKIDKDERKGPAAMAATDQAKETVSLPAKVAASLARARAADQEALRKSRTRAGRAAAREWQEEIVRDRCEAEVEDAWRASIKRGQEARDRLNAALIDGQVKTAVWLAPSRRLLPLQPDECRKLIPAPGDRNQVAFDGEPGWFVASEKDVDRVFGRPAAKPKSGRSPRPYWEEAGREALEWLKDEGSPREPGSGDQARLEKHMAEWLTARGHEPAASTIRAHCKKWIAEFRAWQGSL